MQCELRQGLDLVANPNGRWLNCLMSAKKIETQITTTNSNGLCDTLVKLTVEFIVEASLQPLQGIKSADVQVTLHSVSAVINDGFLINNINSSSPTRTDSSLNEENALSSNSELTRDIWLQLANIPKHMQVHTDKICISFVNRDQRNLRLDISQVVQFLNKKKLKLT
ncbi:uncharacterized protein LOC114574558 [Exaiptasia diaphana]|uniref:Uncharacterized protein n=1 Tax=Exaiptasia diaphana TaxID=2652724 RepID=A0A913YFG3_EXADI|nr:uncharacterized protein LOC114574558 [Exaiptasia diaphana]